MKQWCGSPANSTCEKRGCQSGTARFQAGNTIEKYEYSIYGEVNIVAKQNGETRPVSIIGNPYYFTGRRLDTETGLYYYRARMYSASLGRFLQTDPIGYADGINWYLYCDNNPLVSVDPYGLCGEGRSTWDGWVENAKFFDAWVFGLTPPSTAYGPTSPRTQDLKKWVGTGLARQGFINAAGDKDYTVSDPYMYTYKFGLIGALETGLNPTGQFVGGGTFYIYPNPDGKTQTVIFDNTTAMSSFFYHLYPEA